MGLIAFPFILILAVVFFGWPLVIVAYLYHRHKSRKWDEGYKAYMDAWGEEIKRNDRKLGITGKTYEFMQH